MEQGFEVLVKDAQISNLVLTRGTDDKGIGILLQLRDSSGVPYAFHIYVPYEAPGGIHTNLTEELEQLTSVFLYGTSIDLLQDVSGQNTDGGLRVVELEDVELPVSDLWGPCWQRIG